MGILLGIVITLVFIGLLGWAGVVWSIGTVKARINKQ